jgi:2-polyprenyl-3-methyl-5-hydroxy-6-metoxy-1,4-benzoquinol methylase
VSYCIRPGYEPRSTPDLSVLHVDAPFQPDVYRLASLLARARGAKTIVDVGCGDGIKTAELRDELGVEVRALDLVVRGDAALWVEQYDIEGGLDLPACDLVIAADVIEHLARPDILLDKILDTGAAWVLSTPERNLEYGHDHNGPPANLRHVREWTLAEFGRLLDRRGMSSIMLVTRSDARLSKWATIVAITP